MKPISFRQQTCVFAKDQPQYLPLPAHIDPDGVVTFCWQLSWRDRLRMLVTGKLWHQVLTFGHPLQPQRPTSESPFAPPRVTLGWREFRDAWQQFRAERK